MSDPLHVQVIDKSVKDDVGVTRTEQHVYVVDSTGNALGELAYTSEASMTVNCKGYPVLRLEILVGPESLSNLTIQR